MQIEFDVDDASLADFARRLARLRRTGNDMSPALEDVAADFRRMQERGFYTEGSSHGHPWKRLSDAYRRHRIAQGRGTQILTLRGGKGGRLGESLFNRPNSWHRETVRPDELFVGTALGIARIHQEGATIRIPGRSKPTRIPARPVVRVQDRDVERWGEILQSHLTGENAGVVSRVGL